jgi:hypothetical protein
LYTFGDKGVGLLIIFYSVGGFCYASEWEVLITSSFGLHLFGIGVLLDLGVLSICYELNVYATFSCSKG